VAESPTCGIAGIHADHRRCCWCPRVFISDLVSVYVSAEYHAICRMCLRHVFPYKASWKNPSVAQVRNLVDILIHGRDPNGQERLTI
jgi:hypothetical protein